jgi:hypothetical protein
VVKDLALLDKQQFSLIEEESTIGKALPLMMLQQSKIIKCLK